MTKILNTNKGFTLIEVVIYLALFSIIIGGALVSVYNIIESSGKLENKVVMQEEANFLLRKINWVLNGARDYTISGNKLTIKPSSDFINWDGSSNVTLIGSQLNSSNVTVTEFSYFPKTVPSKGIEVDFSLKVNETGETEDFQVTRFFR